MQIERAQLRHFRNYVSQDVTFHPECNVIYGDNAQGKTNLLEALACLSTGKSPRVRSDRDMISFGAEEAYLSGFVRAAQRDFQIDMVFSHTRRRRQSLNGVSTRSGGVAGIVRTVFFQPEDLQLIRAGAAARRRFMDIALCQLRPAYAQALTAFQRALVQKTRILRDCTAFPGLLDVLPEFNEQLIAHGTRIIRYRARFTQSLEQYAAVQHQACSGGRETLSVHYRTVSGITDPAGDPEQTAAEFRHHMETHANAEKSSGQCLSGPHKDDLIVEINGREAKAWSSQGQTRTAALSLKLAEREMYYRAAGEYPVLLLDDVLSELDPGRQEFVINRVREGQIFLTCCEEDRLTRLLNGKILHVSAGKISE